MNLTTLSDNELLTQTRKLIEREREVLLMVMRHLREIERRRLYADLKQPSLFAYCVNVLGYSDAQADRRIKAMRMIRELPQVEEKIAAGELALTNVAKAAEFFRQEAKVTVVGVEKKLEVLGYLENKSTRAAEKLLLEKSSTPAPEVKETVRQVTASVAEVKFAADDMLSEKLQRLRGLLAHKNPNMKNSELINELCDIALEKLDPLRQSKAKNKSTPAPESKANGVAKRIYISKTLKQKIWREANGKCTNCHSEFNLEIDHLHPLSLRLLCRSCNQRAAIAKIGQTTMMRYLS